MQNKSMNNSRRSRRENGSEQRDALRLVLNATGGNAKVRELYQLLTTIQAAEFLGVSLSYIQHATGRGEVPCVRIGKGDPRYRIIDLISWQEQRLDLGLR
jgi:excisionase family DNA binding protein